MGTDKYIQDLATEVSKIIKEGNTFHKAIGIIFEKRGYTQKEWNEYVSLVSKELNFRKSLINPKKIRVKKKKAAPKGKTEPKVPEQLEFDVCIPYL